MSFNLPAKPAGCSVTVARLRLWQTAGTNGRTIQAYRANAAWTESGAGGVTWNTAPGTAGTPATLASSNGTGWREWTGANMVTLVEALYMGPNNGFVLRDATEGASSAPEQKYQSRQGSPDSQDPELVVTFG